MTATRCFAAGAAGGAGVWACAEEWSASVSAANVITRVTMRRTRLGRKRRFDMRGLLLLRGAKFLSDSDYCGTEGGPPGCCGYLKEAGVGWQRGKMTGVVCWSANRERRIRKAKEPAREAEGLARHQRAFRQM